MSYHVLETVMMLRRQADQCDSSRRLQKIFPKSLDVQFTTPNRYVSKIKIVELEGSNHIEFFTTDSRRRNR